MLLQRSAYPCAAGKYKYVVHTIYKGDGYYLLCDDVDRGAKYLALRNLTPGTVYWRSKGEWHYEDFKKYKKRYSINANGYGEN